MDTRPDGSGKRVEIAVDAPVPHPLTYLVPSSLIDTAEIGKRALVPLGRRKVTGYIVGFPEGRDSAHELREVLAVLDPVPLFDPTSLKLFRWASDYYFRPLAETIKAALPAGINVASKRWAKLSDAGRKALEPPLPAELKPSDRALLRWIGEEDGAYLDALAKQFPDHRLEAALRRLAESGWVELEHRVEAPRTREKTERVFRLARPGDNHELEALSRRAPEQARMLETLRRRGEATLVELASEFKDPSRLTRLLTRAGLAALGRRVVGRQPFSLALELGPAPRTLMPEQAAAVAAIEAALAVGRFEVFMLQGVTGSGKTEVYLRAIGRALELGRGSIMLVPEIGLTPQLISRLRGRLPADKLAVLHSGLSAGERLDEWRRLHRGEARVAVGARSAVFAPVANLGLIVVDEEQDSAYKQDHGFTYQARDVAVMRGKLAGTTVVLGSATPSLESSHRARTEGGYRLLTLPKRVEDRPLPEIEIVDLRESRFQSEAAALDAAASHPGSEQAAEADPIARPDGASHELRVKDRDLFTGRELISAPLRQALVEVLERGEQAILFLNRRGVAAFLLCRDCGQIVMCPNCDVSLSHHQKAPGPGKVDRFYGEPGEGGFLLCHYCGYHVATPGVCPKCRGVRLSRFGVGVEQVEALMAELFPGARVMRMDSDAVTGKESYFTMLDAIARRRVDIVVGTQMAAKGHDLPGVTLVGVLLADQSLALPDFRAAERTFQILTQVAGRAGRGDRPGRVIIQTLQPKHYSVKLARGHDFEAFYEKEIESRRKFFYPPFSRLCVFTISGINPDAVKQYSRLLGKVAKRTMNLKDFQGRVGVLGPVRAPIGRIKGKTRMLALIKADAPAVLGLFCRTVMARLEQEEPPRGVDLELDRDPGAII